MRTLFIFLTLLLSSCGNTNHDNDEMASSADTKTSDDLTSSNWELLGNGGILGYYFGPNGEFLRAASRHRRQFRLWGYGKV
jgi:hypothetical protein